MVQQAFLNDRNGQIDKAHELLPTKDEDATHGTPKELSAVRVFRDQYAMEWASVMEHGHHETHRLNSKWFRQWLTRDYLRVGKDVSQHYLREQIAKLEAMADGPQQTMGNRSIWVKDKKELLVDLADDQWRAVRVTDRGWSIETYPPAVFRRFAHQQAMPVPDPNGKIEELLEYGPALASKGDQLLLLAWVVTALLPIPRPILTLVGPHGSAKSTLATFLRRLLDPSQTALLGKDARADLPLVFFKHAVPNFDNIDGLTGAEADLFCQGVTGRGIARRKLYTDADEFILSFQRAIIVNGLGLPTNRPDYLDRALILELERVTPERRRVLEHIESSFTAALPSLLGGLLNTLSVALARLPEVSTEKLSRMADFHRMGRAVAEVLGFDSQEFDDAYQVAEARQRRGAFDNTLALTLLLFVRQVKRWQGEATDLLQRLHETAKANQIRQSPEFWPATPMGLGRQLKQLSESLARHGVRISRLRRVTARLIALEYDSANDAVGDED